MKYFAVHKSSNTVTEVIRSRTKPKETNNYKYYRATSAQLKSYQSAYPSREPIDIYSLLPKPEIDEILTLTANDEIALREYIATRRRNESIEKMAAVWRVSEFTIRQVIDELIRPTVLAVLYSHSGLWAAVDDVGTHLSPFRSTALTPRGASPLHQLRD